MKNSFFTQLKARYWYVANRVEHWTPRYIFDRVRLWRYESKHPDHPWITRAAIEILTTLLRPDDVGLELGSGRSTIWLAKRVGHLTSLEHHSAWHERISGIMRAQNISNVSYNHLSLGGPHVDFVKALPDHTFDFILVDGPERDQCAIACISKLKQGGILIVDNANLYLPHASRAPGSRGVGGTPASPLWAEFVETVRSWRLIWTTNGVSDTAIWIKPINVF